MYADDSTIYLAANKENELNKALNVELNSIVKWVKNNKHGNLYLTVNRRMICTP